MGRIFGLQPQSRLSLAYRAYELFSAGSGAGRHVSIPGKPRLQSRLVSRTEFIKCGGMSGPMAARYLPSPCAFGAFESAGSE
jgi:hypothetical protein